MNQLKNITPLTIYWVLWTATGLLERAVLFDGVAELVLYAIIILTEIFTAF